MFCTNLESKTKGTASLLVKNKGTVYIMIGNGVGVLFFPTASLSSHCTHLPSRSSAYSPEGPRPSVKPRRELVAHSKDSCKGRGLAGTT